MQFIKKKRVIIFLVVAVMLAGISVPWKSVVENCLKNYLASQGFRDVQLTVSGIGISGIELKDVSIGSKAPLHIDQFSLGISPASLFSGQLKEIKIAGLALKMNKEGETWAMSGLDASAQPAGNSHTGIPVTKASLEAIPVDALTLQQSSLDIDAKTWQAEVPLQFVWHKSPVPELDYEAKGLSAKLQNINITTGDVTLNAKLNESEQKWPGQWHMNDVKVTGTGDMPMLKGDGTVIAEEDKIIFAGQFASEDKAYAANFRLNYFINDTGKSQLDISGTTLPWNGGIVSVDPFAVPLGKKENLHLNLKINRVSLAEMLKQLTGKDVAASGAISGTLPVTLGSDGSLSVQAGKLSAEEPGVIAMPPDTIPGDNEQVAVARNVLKNFHYSLLAIEMDQDKDNKLSVMMRLSGSNPDEYGGKLVNLNVHLSGDLLNLLQQNLMILTNPQKILQQGQHAQ